MSPKLQGYGSYDAFTNFKSKFKGCEVAEVTRVAQGFCGGFSLVSPKLRGYGSYGAFTNFQKQIERLRGYGGYEGCAGLLLKIFPSVPKVTRLRKLRCFYKFSKTN